MNDVSYAGGVLRATLAAGPIFVLTLMFGALLMDGLGPFGIKDAIGIIPLLMLSLAVGMMISFIPVLTGGTVMAFAGARWPWARRRAVWAGAGALFGMALVLPFEDGRAPMGWAPYALMAVTGAICALIVRYGTRWSSPNPRTTPHAINACAAK